MDQVLNLLSVSYYPTNAKADQVAATDSITNALNASPVSSLSVLLQLTTAPTTESGAAIPDEMRFIAMSRVKNFFVHDWSEHHSLALKNDPNFLAFREELLVTVAKLAGDQYAVIRKQLCEAIRVLVSETRWNFYDKIAPQLRALASITPETIPEGVDVMGNAVTLIELTVSLTRHFSFNFTAEVRAGISKDLLTILPPLLTLWKTLGTPQLSPNNLHFIHQIIKIYEDCSDILVDVSRVTRTANSTKLDVEAGASTQSMGEDAALGALMINWLEFMVGYPQEYLGAFMAATGNDVSKVVGNSRGYISFVRTVKRIGLIAFGYAEDANRNPPLDVKNSRKKAKEQKVITKGNRKIYKAPTAAEVDNSSWITQKCWVAGTLPLRFAQMWLQWLQWATQQVSSTTFEAEDDVLAAQRKASIQAIRFIKMGITSEDLYPKVIIPHFMEIIGLLIGSLCYNSEDVEMYRDDAEGDLQEFCIHLEEDSYLMNEFTLRQASANCIVAFAVASKSFHDPNLIFQILEALNAALVSGVDANGEEISGTPHLTYGYLHMLGHLKNQIQKRDALWKGAMEQALLTHIVPRLQSRHLYLRVKALQVLGKYARIPMSPDNLGSFVNALGQLLNDKDSRVRLAAIGTLCNFLALKAVRPYLKLVLVPLVNECLLLMERVRCLFIPSCLQYLCESYGVELMPVVGKVAAGVSQQLCAALYEVAQEVNAEVVDESEAAQRQSEQNGLSIMANCDALNHLVLACDHNLEMLKIITPDVLRPFQMIYTNEDLFDFVEKVTETLMHLLYLSKPITPELWAFFPSIHNLVMNHFQGVDNFGDLASCIDNYLSNGPAEFLANAEAMRMSLEMCNKMVNEVSTTHHGREKFGATQLFSGIFHQCKGVCPEAVVPYMPEIIRIVMTGLQSKQNLSVSRLKSGLTATVFDAMWFSPAHCCQILEGAGATVYFLKSVGAEFPKIIPSMSTLVRKQFILGITSFLDAYTSQGAAVCPSLAALSPAEQSAILGPLINIAVACIVANKKVYALRSKRLEKGLAETEIAEDIDEHLDADVDLDDDEDLFPDSDGDDEDEDENDNDDDIDYSSPIDDICEVQFFLTFVVKATSQPLAPLVTVASMEDITSAAQVSATFMSYCKQMEEKEKAVHAIRAQELAQ